MSRFSSRFIFVVAAGAILLAQSGLSAEQVSGLGGINIIKVLREGAPLYQRADGGSDIARYAELGEEFQQLEAIDEFYLIKDEVSGSFLYIDKLDAVYAKSVANIQEPQAYMRAPDDDWYWLESTFFAIEDEDYGEVKCAKQNKIRIAMLWFFLYAESDF